MDPDERQQVEARIGIGTLDDPALRRLVILEQSQYRPEVVEIARTELARRRLSVLSPEEYWQRFRDEWLTHIRFCYQCWMETTEESPSPFSNRFEIGPRLRGSRAPCTTCGSIVQTMSFCLFVFPLVRLGQYRVIRDGAGQRVGRKLRTRGE
jgi:hypothetical protein